MPLIRSSLFTSHVFPSLTLAVLTLSAFAAPAKKSLRPEALSGALIWQDPGDVGARNLYYGPGGEKDQPHGPFTFEKEDLDGSNPKFVVRDRDGVKWKAKLGTEARPETVASRLVWAVGYFTDEDYFLPDFQVQEMPAHLHRGQALVAADGSMRNVRLKRYLKGQEKLGPWSWRGPIGDARGLNGLRVMMALIDNWDLKDENNSIYEYKGEHPIYVVSDLGASFGTTGNAGPAGKGNLQAYAHAQFITRATPEYVDFKTPSRPALTHLLFFNPPAYLRRLRLESIGRHVPLSDVRWIGRMLARLSPDQIEAAFRAAGYGPDDVTAFAAVVETRIAALNKL
jgi:hypothetical protein